MKGHHCHHSSPLVPSPVAKRRCTGLAAAVPLLVACSILLPLAFLLAIHRPGTLPHHTTVAGKENQGQEVAPEENPKSCELEYGSYCLWSVEHKEVMKDAIVKRLKDQLFMARAHYPSIAKLKHQEIFTRELKQNIQEHERMLSDTIADADLPPLFAKKLEKMEHTIERAKSCEVGCSNIERKLRQLLDLTEDEAYFHTRQSAFLYHLGVRTMPKTHHCLKMRSTVEYFKSTSIRMDQLNKQKLESPTFHHYVMFSRNVLAASTAINSTVMNSKDSDRFVFHLFTDAQNFYAMKHWFDKNSYLEATVHVTNIEDQKKLSKDVDSLEMQQLFPAEEFRVTFRNHSEPFQRQTKTEYISLFGHSHFLLPDLLPSLNRVIVLDDDLIVQKGLSSLWNLNMGDKVIGAIQFCGVRLGQLKAYIEKHNFDTTSCVWLSGLNVIELEKWRDPRITSLYGQLLQKLQKDSPVSRQLRALPISLLAFQDLIYPLKDSWVQSGLGHDYGISRIDIEKAATLHYNGVMKPWLDLGIHDYKSYWRKYMTNGERFMTDWWRKATKRIPKEKKKGMNTIIILGSWILWKHRNAYVFEGTRPCVTRLLIDFKNEHHLWCMAGAHGLRTLGLGHGGGLG